MNYYTIPGLKDHKIQGVSGKISESARIIDIVVKEFNLSLNELMGVRRFRSIVYPRQICMYLIKRNTHLSLTQIGKIFGKDHTSVIHSCNSIRDHLDTNLKARRDFLKLEELI